MRVPFSSSLEQVGEKVGSWVKETGETLANERQIVGRGARMARAAAVSAVRGAQGRFVLRRAPTLETRLVLFEKETCPYSRLVREALCHLDLDAVIFPCPAGASEHRERLRNLRGDESVPFLVDSNRQRHVSDAFEIVQYLYWAYGDSSPWRYISQGRLTLALSKLASRLQPNDEPVGMVVEPPEELLELWSFESSVAARPVRELLFLMGMPYILHNVPYGSRKRTALQELVGHTHVPVLRDPNTNTLVSGTEDVLEYLKRTYLNERVAQAA